MKKIFYLVLMFSLFACSKKEEFSTSFPASSPKEGELSVWVRTQNSVPALEAFNQKMKAEGRNISLKINVISSDDFIPAFASALSAKQTIDLALIDLVMTPAFSAQNSFFDLTDLYNTLDYKDKINEPMGKLGLLDNKIYAIPNAIDASTVMYNKKIFAQAGITKEPSNYAELREALKKITTTTDKIGYVFSGADAGGMMFTLLPWIWANGGDLVSDDGKTAKLDSPQAVEFMQFLLDLMVDGSIPEAVTSYSWNDYQGAFQQERVAMVGGGSFWVEPFKKAGIDFGVFPFFSKDGTSKSGFIGGDLSAIPTTAKYPHIAWEVIQYLLSEEVQVEQYAKRGTIPVRSDFFNNKYFTEEPRYRTIAESTVTGKVPYVIQYFELYNPFKMGIQKILTKQVPVADALKQTNVDMQRVLDRPVRQSK